MTQLSPSEVRKRILAEHGTLRGQLARLEELLGEPAAAAELVTTLTEFASGFLAHVAEEERILRPLLADIDAWGALRVEMMDEEHQAQRAQVARLQELAVQPSAVWLGDLRDFIAELREDMAGEEKDCLNPNLLRDDTVTIDSFGG